MALTLTPRPVAADDPPVPMPAAAAPAALRTTIEARGGWRWVDLGELWRARELVRYLAWRDIRVRYRQTALGAAWALLQPLGTMAVFAAVFGRMAGDPGGGVPYPLFALAGLLPWSFFASAVAAAGSSVVGSERLITKVYFPRLALPLAASCVAAVDFAVALGLLAAAAAWCGVAPGPGLLLAPAVVGLIALAAVGLGTGLAALNVAYRDFKHVTPFLLQLAFFATPGVYLPASVMPGGRLGGLLAWNPMNALVVAFRASVLGGPVDRVSLILAAAWSAAAFAIGCAAFRRVEDDFADLI